MLFGVLDHKIDGDETEGAAFTPPAMDEYGAKFLPSLFDEADDGIDNCLIDDVLDCSFFPVKGEEGHALDDWVVLAVPACAVDDMGDLIEAEPLDVLTKCKHTWAIISSPINMQSVTFVGIDIYYWLPTLSLCCCIV